MLRQAKLLWHSTRYRFNVIAFNDCLDDDMKKQFKLKIHYHEEKIRGLEALR